MRRVDFAKTIADALVLASIPFSFPGKNKKVTLEIVRFNLIGVPEEVIREINAKGCLMGAPGDRSSIGTIAGVDRFFLFEAKRRMVRDIAPMPDTEHVVCRAFLLKDEIDITDAEFVRIASAAAAKRSERGGEPWPIII